MSLVVLPGRRKVVVEWAADRWVEASREGQGE